MTKAPSKAKNHDHDEPDEPNGGQTDPPPYDPPAAEPTQEELDKAKPSLSPQEAEQLLRAGHRLRKRGDDPKHWIAMTRHDGEMAIAIAASPEAIASFLDADLIISE